ncbi:MAG TPA: hypothetical protein VG105_15790 [Paraburkholderia sp.]|nr:hypothetical protein [Paraburkholderia sp.]
MKMSSTGPAYTTREVRYGVPLSYISEKLSQAIEDTHAAGRAHPEARKRLAHVMYSQTKAFLALHNLLGVADAAGLPEQLLEMDRRELDRWIAAVVTHGDLFGTGDA